MRRGILRWRQPVKPALLIPPVSKSDAMRIAIIRYARSEANVPLPEPLPDDVGAVLNALEALNSEQKEIEFNVGLGGGPFRFLLSLAAMTPGRILGISMAKPLRNRPHEPLFSALKESLELHGLNIDTKADPVIVNTTKLQLPDELHFHIEPSSSQYLTGLLLAGADAVAKGRTKRVEIELTGQLASGLYAELTAKYLRDAGFILKVESDCWSIDGFEEKNWNPLMPGDWSSAAYLAVWAWQTGGTVEITKTDQPDTAVVEVLGKAGLDFTFGDGTLYVKGSLRSGLKADARDCPDLIPTLATVALIAPENSRFENVGILREKESDRLQFIIDLVRAAGGEARLDDERLTIQPAVHPGGTISIETKADHRRAFCGSLFAALGWDEVVIDDIDCVSKSFPGYWEEIAKCGAVLELCP